MSDVIIIETVVLLKDDTTSKSIRKPKHTDYDEEIKYICSLPKRNKNNKEEGYKIEKKIVEEI